MYELFDPEKFFNLNVKIPIIVKVTQKLADDLVSFNLPGLLKVKPIPKRCSNNHKYYVNGILVSNPKNFCSSCFIPAIPIPDHFFNTQLNGGETIQQTQPHPNQLSVIDDGLLGLAAGFSFLNYIFYLICEDSKVSFLDKGILLFLVAFVSIVFFSTCVLMVRGR